MSPHSLGRYCYSQMTTCNNKGAAAPIIVAKKIGLLGRPPGLDPFDTRHYGLQLRVIQGSQHGNAAA